MCHRHFLIRMCWCKKGYFLIILIDLIIFNFHRLIISKLEMKKEGSALSKNPNKPQKEQAVVKV